MFASEGSKQRPDLEVEGRFGVGRVAARCLREALDADHVRDPVGEAGGHRVGAVKPERDFSAESTSRGEGVR